MNDDNVVDLDDWKDKKPQVVWQCACGCQLYYILNTAGELECSSCGKIILISVD